MTAMALRVHLRFWKPSAAKALAAQDNGKRRREMQPASSGRSPIAPALASDLEVRAGHSRRETRSGADGIAITPGPERQTRSTLGQARPRCDFRRRIRRSALLIREQKQWSSSPP